MHRKLHACISAVDRRSQADEALTELANSLQSHLWLDAAGQLDMQALGQWVGALGDKHSNLRNVVGAVLAVIRAGSLDKLQALDQRNPDGSVGIVLAQFAAAEEQYCKPGLRKYEHLELPSWSVQCDVQGNIMVGTGWMWGSWRSWTCALCML